MSIWIKWASLLMFAAVVSGAFGSHILKSRLNLYEMVIYQTAVLYHFIHALGLFAVAWVSTLTVDPKVKWAGICLIVGIGLFSGSLYLLAVTGFKKLGMITPLGGLSFLAGWILLFLAKVQS